MAKAEKYRILFTSLDGSPCQVRFFYEGHIGGYQEYLGGDRTFLLGEFNTAEDLFKPVRPQIATINIVANSLTLSIDDFLADNDTDIDVYFLYNNNPTTYYWRGSLLQDDFQETWIDTDHVITLKATERIGSLQQIMLSNAGSEIVGTYNVIDYLTNAMQGTVQDFSDYTIINNLFHSSMTSTNTNHPLDQCQLNAKTFQKEADQYENCYDVVTKINKAFNQTIFMYNSKWFILRLEELYTSSANNLRGVRINALTGRSLVNKRYDIQVGVNEDIKPISPEMLRFIRRRTKIDTVQFNYDQFNEIFCNQTFQRGSLVSSTSTEKKFNVNDWTYLQTFTAPVTPPTGEFYRKEVYDAANNLKDNYIYATVANNLQDPIRYVKSCGTDVLAGEKFTFSLDTRWDASISYSGTFRHWSYGFQLVTATNYYWMDDLGTWLQSDSTWTTNRTMVNMYWSNGMKTNEWTTVEVNSKEFPADGKLYIILYMPPFPFSILNRQIWYKSINIKYFTSFNSNTQKTIQAIQSIYTKSATVNNNFDDQIYLDDGPSKVFKGTLFETDSVTMTDKTWYRYRFNSETFGFRQQNDIAHWEQNRFNRNKIDVTFYGIQWNDEGVMRPIGLMNTIIFVDDDPNKIYAILNLKEIDFQNNTWTATLIEVYDSTKDSTITYDSYQDKYIYE